MKKQNKFSVKCPHCNNKVYPSVMLNAQRVKKTTKAQRSEIAKKAGKQSVLARKKLSTVLL